MKPIATIGVHPIRCASCVAKHRLFDDGWNSCEMCVGTRGGVLANRSEPSLFRPTAFAGAMRMPAMRRSVLPIMRALRACAVE